MKLQLRAGEKLSVLVVDDEADIRETLVMFLEMMDIFSFIVQADDGSDAFRKCQNQKFDLIVTDLMMPKMRGIELIRSFKAYEKKQKIEEPTPFIILSANITGDEVKKALHFGVKYLVTKPCTAEAFVQKVTEVLAREKKDKVKVLKA